VRTFFSVGIAITEPDRAAITACVDWIPAIDANRELRDGAEIAELTHLVDSGRCTDLGATAQQWAGSGSLDLQVGREARGRNGGRSPIPAT
jgi:hypothetical protein